MRNVNLKTGGKSVIDRLVQLYGFKSKTELCKHFDITNSTLSTWLSRDYFPATLVIQCALETGISLNWLVLGEGSINVSTEVINPNAASVKVQNAETNYSSNEEKWLEIFNMLTNEEKKNILYQVQRKGVESLFEVKTIENN